jgi:hypothetical protein
MEVILKKGYLFVGALCIALYASPDLRNFVADYLVMGSINNAGKAFNALGEKIRNTKLETTKVEIDATLDTLQKANKQIVVEGSISNYVWIRQFCKVGWGSEINIYNATPDLYSLNLIIDFSQVKEKNGDSYVVPIEAINWVINVAVRDQPHSKVNSKFSNLATTVPLYVAVGMYKNYTDLFNTEYDNASIVKLVDGGESIKLQLPPLESVPFVMQNGYTSYPKDFTPKYSDFIWRYFPDSDVKFEEKIQFNLGLTLKAKNVLTTRRF